MGDKCSMKYLIWHITHGVELGISNDFANKHIELVMSFIPKIYQDYIIPHATNWSSIVEDRQLRTWQIEKDLSRSVLRKVCVKIACDLLWYRSSKGRGMDIYRSIHNRLENELDLLLGKYGADSKIVRQGHSLGSQIMLDACFESKHITTGLLTMGSPISKYSGMYEDWGNAPKELKWWLNFYSTNDLVASTLQNHPSKSISELVEDVQTKNFNPLDMLALRAHVMYWQNKETCKKIADRLVKHLEATI